MILEVRPVFLGEADDAFVLALLNTTPTIDGRRRDTLAEDAGARAWVAQHVADPPARTDFRLLRQTRDGLQRIACGEATMAILRPALHGVTVRPAIGEAGLRWELAAPSGHEMSVRAVLAWEALQASAPGRVRPCANGECSLFLIDRSKSNSARWCSMAGCGNRLKARRHYRRQSEQT
jgi:predicted RNA-binding Zn ribbon-like protein